jgi:hypothetical protein
MYISQKRKYIDHIFANAQMMCVWLEQQWKTLLGVRVDFFHASSQDLGQIHNSGRWSFVMYTRFTIHQDRVQTIN